jgi:hypothetical protein
MLQAIWRSLQILFGSLGQGWTGSGSESPVSDLGHEMDPNG